jgi:hypothetical protein
MRSVGLAAKERTWVQHSALLSLLSTIGLALAMFLRPI